MPVGILSALRILWDRRGAVALALAVMVFAALWFGFRYEHHRARVEQARADKATADWRAMRDAITGPHGWKVAYAALEARREVEARAAAASIAAASEARSTATSDAFNQGYAAGRVAGRKTGASHATSVPSPARPAGGVRDPSDDFAANWSRGAYRP